MRSLLVSVPLIEHDRAIAILTMNGALNALSLELEGALKDAFRALAGSWPEMNLPQHAGHPPSPSPSPSPSPRSRSAPARARRN